jgi:hypothetical protein
VKRLLRYLVIVPMIVAPLPVNANELYDRYFADVDGAKVRYSRTYDAAHLQQHPKQATRLIELRKRISPTGGAFEVTLGLMVKGKSELFTSPAYCSTENDGFLCRDGGTFRLTPSTSSGLTLRVIGDGIRMEGESGFIEVGGKRSDASSASQRLSIRTRA